MGEARRTGVCAPARGGKGRELQVFGATTAEFGYEKMAAWLLERGVEWVALERGCTGFQSTGSWRPGDWKFCWSIRERKPECRGRRRRIDGTANGCNGCRPPEQIFILRPLILVAPVRSATARRTRTFGISRTTPSKALAELARSMLAHGCELRSEWDLRALRKLSQERWSTLPQQRAVAAHSSDHASKSSHRTFRSL
jgi:hypothetical protein